MSARRPSEIQADLEAELIAAVNRHIIPLTDALGPGAKSKAVASSLFATLATVGLKYLETQSRPGVAAADLALASGGLFQTVCEALAATAHVEAEGETRQ